MAALTKKEDERLLETGRQRRFTKGMAAAAAISLAAHGAVLWGRVPYGGAASPAPRSAPSLVARIVPAPEIVRASAGPTAATALPAESPVEPGRVPEQPARVADPTPAPVETRAPAPAVVPVEPAQAVPQLLLRPERQPEPVLASTSAGSTYLSTGLDPPPRPLTEIEPTLPEAAGSRGGSVVLRLFINERGGVDKVEVLSATPPGLFDTSAIEASLRVRFSPGYFSGIAVKSQVTYEMTYPGANTGVEASGRTY